jgi:hypothetical protein
MYKSEQVARTKNGGKKMLILSVVCECKKQVDLARMLREEHNIPTTFKLETIRDIVKYVDRFELSGGSDEEYMTLYLDFDEFLKFATAISIGLLKFTEENNEQQA